MRSYKFCVLGSASVIYNDTKNKCASTTFANDSIAKIINPHYNSVLQYVNFRNLELRNKMVQSSSELTSNSLLSGVSGGVLHSLFSKNPPKSYTDINVNSSGIVVKERS